MFKSFLATVLILLLSVSLAFGADAYTTTPTVKNHLGGATMTNISE